MTTIKGKGKLANTIGSELPPVPPAPSFCEQIENCPQFQSLEGRVNDLEQAPAGNGDMQKIVYDTNDDGVVDDADNAQNLSGQPASYYLQNLDDVLSRGNSAGGQNITDVNELVAAIVRGVTALQILAGSNLTLSAGDTASILGPTLASILSNEGQVVIDGDRITIQHSGEVRFSASLLDMLGTTRVRNLPAAVDNDEPIRKQEYDTALGNKADLVGGVIPTSQLPAIAITDFLGAVANQSAMLALLGQRGDWCIRQDQSMAYVLIAEDATQLANWVAIPHPQSPVMSVNGQTGVIVLSTTNIGEGSNLYWTQTRFDNAFGAKTTDNLTEGATRLYFTNARVLATTLTGLDTSTNAVITSGDTVLVALGKLQKQITDLTNSLGDAAFKNTGTGAGTVAAGNDSRFERTNLLGKNFTEAVNTATTSEEILHSHQIAANQIATNDLLEFYSAWKMSVNANAKTARCYINTSNSLSGATLIATFSLAGSNGSDVLHRMMPVINDTTLEAYGSTSAMRSMYGISTTQSAQVTVPSLSAGFWLIITGQKAVSGDTLSCRFSIVRRDR